MHVEQDYGGQGESWGREVWALRGAVLTEERISR